ncbi:MAG: methylated-DNA--[protein]-cysteine S-methyltransferase [Gammaproteobacteria bacterium]|nr:methylated-DNA--[protein]-cysteine S-methyltransferase [Gammaproteobacteria bacterium]
MDRETRMRRIWETIQDIPRGCVANYGQIAEIAGIPRGARQVGYALQHSPKDLELPWHRVITSSGKSAFDPDSRAFKTQRDRLTEEGVVMLNGKVDMQKYRWQPDLDELLWKPSSTWDED